MNYGYQNLEITYTHRQFKELKIERIAQEFPSQIKFLDDVILKSNMI